MGFFDFLRRKRAPEQSAPETTRGIDGARLDDDAYLRRYGERMDPEQMRNDVARSGRMSLAAFDSITNWMTGQGGVNDPATAIEYLYAATVNEEIIRNMCRASWLARKIVWKRPKDMMRPGYSLVFEGMGDKPKGSTDTAGDRLRFAITRRWDADNKLLQAMAWGRQFGGAVIVIDIKGQLLTDPLPVKNGMVDYSSIKKGSLNSLRVWDRWRATYDGEIDDNPNSPNRGCPMFHVLSSDGSMVGQRVHWSRVIRFDGDIVDWYTWRANACWHDSVLQVVIDTLKQYDQLTGAITSLVPKARQDVVYAKKAAEMCSTDEGRIKMGRRYAAAQRLSSMYHVRVYDIDAEKAEQQTFNFANLDHIWEKAMMEMGGGAGYPASVLFDNMPSGITGGSAGDSSKDNYYDDLGSDRDLMLKPRQLALYECIARDEFGDLPKGFSIAYNPFRTASELELSQIDKARADADNLRIQNGIITPGLAARELKEHSVYTTMTQEDVDLAEMEPPPPEEVPPISGAPGVGLPGEPGSPPTEQGSGESSAGGAEERFGWGGGDLEWSSDGVAADYEPTQKRNENGEWTSGGASGAGGEMKGGGGGGAGGGASSEGGTGHSAAAKKENERWESSLTSGEREAISSYTGSGYHEINSSLRSGKKNLYTKDLDAAIAKSSVPEDTVVYRGGAIESSKLKVGLTATDKGYVSTSTSSAYAKTYSKRVSTKTLGELSSKKMELANWNITVKKGSKAAFLGSENELLIHRNAKFRITKVVRSQNWKDPVEVHAELIN